MNVRTIFVLSFFLVFANFAHAQMPIFIMPKEYDMEMIFQNENGEKERNHVYCSFGNIRTEMKIEGESVVTVVRRDKNLLYQINMTQKEYSEMELPPDFQSLEDVRKDASWRFVGVKKGLDGQEIEKYEGMADAAGERVSMVYWIDRATKLPLRRTINGETVDFYNIRAGAQDPKFFEIPPKFKKVLPAQNSFLPPRNSKSTIQIPANQSQEAR